MPGRFLTDAERERLTRFPAEVPPEDLVNACTLSMTDAIANLRTNGHAVVDGNLVHLSPALYAHINRYGKYHFDAVPSLDEQPHRPLRQPSVLNT